MSGLVESSEIIEVFESKLALKLRSSTSLVQLASLLDTPRHSTSCRLQQLSGDVLLTRILPFVSERTNLASVRTLSKHFNTLLFTVEAEPLWNRLERPFEFCIDTYCPVCMIKKKRKACYSRVLSFLEKCPIHSMQLHCFITDIPATLIALNHAQSVTALDLALTNKSNSLPLDQLLGKEMTAALGRSPFPKLKELTIDSTHLQHIKLAGRAQLLDILGGNLESLSFSGLSPAGLFGILASRCPQLRKLRVDKVNSESELSMYQNEDLEDLELCRANFVLHSGTLVNFPRLRRFRYTPSFRCESAQLEGVIGAVPLSLHELCMEIPSGYANDVINAASRRLKLLKSLSLQSAYEPGCISSESLYTLSRSCLFLKSIDLSSAKSVSDVTLDQEAFDAFATFPSLERIRVRCDDVSLACLPTLLARSHTIRLVVLWQRKKWLTSDRWQSMMDAVSVMNKQYVHVTVELESVL